jgi:hypothetical protein
LPRKAGVKPRPALFRALGHEDPPATVKIQGFPYTRVRIFKHDSWAATALYENESRGSAICKFNRKQSLGPIPMRWIGVFLARNESTVLKRLADTGQVPLMLGDVHVGGVVHPTAIARKFVEGHPLGHREAVHEEFFPRLRSLLDVMHARGMAYVDLHKRENVLVGDDGLPYLIDFQISYASPSGIVRFLFPSRFVLSILQKSDDYHLEKLRRKSLPPEQAESIEIRRPWWIRLHRAVAMPYRQIRRKMFVVLKIRSGKGRVNSEHFTEEALRDEVSA